MDARAEEMAARRSETSTPEDLSAGTLLWGGPRKPGAAESEAGYSSRSPDIFLRAAESRRPGIRGSIAQTDGTASAYRGVDETFLGLRFSGIFQSALYLEVSVVPISILIAVLAAGVTLDGMILEPCPLDRKEKKPPERGCEARALSPDRSGAAGFSRLGSPTLASLRAYQRDEVTHEQGAGAPDARFRTDSKSETVVLDAMQPGAVQTSCPTPSSMWKGRSSTLHDWNKGSS